VQADSVSRQEEERRGEGAGRKGKQAVVCAEVVCGVVRVRGGAVECQAQRRISQHAGGSHPAAVTRHTEESRLFATQCT